MAKIGFIRDTSGPIVHVKGDVGSEVYEIAYIGKKNLVGETIGLTSDDTIIEVYEETTELEPGEIVTGTGSPVPVTLMPGILNNIFDGIERPLGETIKDDGAYTGHGVSMESLDTTKLWSTHIIAKKSDKLFPGAIIAEIPETPAITHRVMPPPGVEGFVLDTMPNGDYTISDTLITLQQLNSKELRIATTRK